MRDDAAMLHSEHSVLQHEYMNVQRMRESQASLHLDGGGAKCTYVGRQMRYALCVMRLRCVHVHDACVRRSTSPRGTQTVVVSVGRLHLSI